MPLVSVIVPNYNHAPYLRERIESILNQTFQDFELILLDDCSTDNSKEVLEQYRNHPKVSQIVYNEKNSGSTFRQWNKGVSLSQGDYIWIAESDDIADHNFLSSINDVIKTYPDAGLFFTASRLIDNAGNITYANEESVSKGVISYPGTAFIKEKLSTSNAIWNASMVVFKKLLYENIDKELFIQMKYCGDWFFYTLLAEQAQVIEIKQVLNNFRVHYGNVSTVAEKSGKSFTEGLFVYNYLLKYLTPIEKIISDCEWAKALYKWKKKYDLQTELVDTLLNEIRKNNKRIVSIFKLYSLFKLTK